MNIFTHKNYPEIRVILKKMVNYTTGIYYRVDENGKIKKRKNNVSKLYGSNNLKAENYTLVIQHNNLIAISKK